VQTRRVGDLFVTQEFSFLVCLDLRWRTPGSAEAWMETSPRRPRPVIPRNLAGWESLETFWAFCPVGGPPPDPIWRRWWASRRFWSNPPVIPRKLDPPWMLKENGIPVTIWVPTFDRKVPKENFLLLCPMKSRQA
jgi:hypothetical protein